MITLQTADNALNSAYLGVLREQLDVQVNPILAKIKQTTADVWGKEIIINIKNNEEYVTLKSELKNLYNTIEISDKAIRASQNNAGAFVNLLNAEIESLIRDYSKASFEYLFKEKEFEIIDKEGNKVFTDKRPTEWINGFCDIVGESEEIFGLKRKDYEVLQPKIKTANDLKVEDVSEILNTLEEKGSNVNVVVCSFKNRNELIKQIEQQGKAIKAVEFTTGGYKAIEIGLGVPLIALKNVSENKIYFLDLEQFTLNQLCDWQWLENENGQILKQVYGEPNYQATLLKYANLMCKDISKQGLLKIKTKED